MKINRIIPAALCALAVTFSGCGPKGPASSTPSGTGTTGSPAAASGDKPKIVFVSNGVASFWTIAEAGVMKAGEELGVEVAFHMPTGDEVEDQKNIVEDLLAQDVDAIAISPVNPDNQLEILNKAADNTKLITVDSDAPKANRLLYLGMDNYDAGRMCGQLVKEALPDGGKIMIFVGRLEQDNARGRRQGVIDELLDRPHNPENFDAPGKELKGDKFTIIGTRTDQFDQSKGKANVEDALSKYSDISGMVGLFGYNPPLILEALKQAGKLGQIKVIGFDENDETLQGIKDGTVHGTVVQNPYMYGYRSVEVLKAIVEGNDSVIPASTFIDIPARQIRRANVGEFWAELNKLVGKEAAPAGKG
jgi:ribose transport system substrate-binding protein